MAASRVIGRLTAALRLDDAQFQKGMRGAHATLQRIGKRMAIAGAGISAAGAGIALAIRGQLNAADDMGKMAQKIGIPVDELSRLKHAADMSGVSMGSVQGAVTRLSRAMASTPDRFKKIGVSVRDVNGEMRPTSEVMADIAQVLSEMPDGAEKTALAMEYLGRSGTELIPMLNGGRDALKGMFDEADDLGIVISPEMSRNAELFNDNISRLTKQFSGLWTMIASNLAPALVRMSDMMVSVATRFRNLSPTMQAFISGLAAAVMVLGPVLSGLGLMIMTAAPFVGAMAKVAVAIKGVSMALLANPIGIAVAAIAGAAYLIYQEWDTVGPWFSDMWDNVKATFGGFRNFVTGIFTGDLGGAVDGLKAAWDGLKAYYQSLWDGIKGIFTYAWENGIKPITDLLGATAAIENGWRRLQSAFDTILGAIGRAFNAAMTIIEPVITGLKWVQDNAKSIMDSLPSQPADGNNRAGNGPISFAPTGGDISAGLARGSSAIEDQGQSDAEGYMSRFRRAFGIQSPSRVMIEYGHFLSQGLGIGIRGSADQVEDAGADLVNRLEQVTMRGRSALEGLFGSVVDGAGSAKRAVLDLIAQIARVQFTNGLMGLPGMGSLATGLGSLLVPSFSRGTPNFSGGIARIHERSGEVLDLPDGTRIWPGDVSRRMADDAGPAGGHMSIGFDASVGDLTAVMRDVAGNVIASERQSIVSDAVGAVARGNRRSKSFLPGR